MIIQQKKYSNDNDLELDNYEKKIFDNNISDQKDIKSLKKPLKTLTINKQDINNKNNFQKQSILSMFKKNKDNSDKSKIIENNSIK